MMARYSKLMVAIPLVSRIGPGVFDLSVMPIPAVRRWTRSRPFIFAGRLFTGMIIAVSPVCLRMVKAINGTRIFPRRGIKLCP